MDCEAQKVSVTHLLMSYDRSEEHTSELQSPDHLVCRLLLEKKKTRQRHRACQCNPNDAKHIQIVSVVCRLPISPYGHRYRLLRADQDDSGLPCSQLLLYARA